MNVSHDSRIVAPIHPSALVQWHTLRAEMAGVAMFLHVLYCQGPRRPITILGGGRGDIKV